MSVSRRQFAQIGFSSIAAGFASGIANAAMPALGLIFPPAGRGIPEEGLAMYPTSVTFLAQGLGLKTMTPDGYDAVLDRIAPTAQSLAQQGARAIVLMGTSLSFYKGAAFNQKLTDSLIKATGLPSTTMSTAVVEGLALQRLACAYSGSVRAPGFWVGLLAAAVLAAAVPAARAARVDVIVALRAE